MARTFSRASQVYPAGNFGPFSIDSFTKNDANALHLTLTVEAWPDVPLLATITLSMDNGAQMQVNIPGRPKNRDGTDATSMTIKLGIPADGIVIDGVPQPAVKRDTNSGQISVEVFQPFRTALTLQAV